MAAASVPLQQLPATWLERAAELEPYAPAAAVAWREAAKNLRETLEATDDAVTLRQAHEIGGYSIDHLQRIVKAGRIQNVGTKGRIRIRRTDVPLKPGHVALRTRATPRSLRPSAVVASALGRDER